MKTLARLFLCFIIISLTGCASIVSKSRWPFSVTTDPVGAKVSIKNKHGQQVYTGKTPAAMLLKSGAGFFSKEAYTVTIDMPGYVTKTVNVRCNLNGWYFGNILIGGVIGMLIVDPATGAMYKLESEGISEDLVKITPAAGTSALKILDKNDLPARYDQYLVRIN